MSEVLLVSEQQNSNSVRSLSLAIEVIPATLEQQPVLANLLELYAHDFSEFFDVEVGPDGRFGYPDLPRYWVESGRHPFLVRVDGRLAGFVLVKLGSSVSGDPAIWDMVEFFVLRRFRRQGVGTAIAFEVWKRFPGPWEIRVMEVNPALGFWERAVAEFSGGRFEAKQLEMGGLRWKVFSLESPPAK
jgi:predicted acetyltransferase